VTLFPSIRRKNKEAAKELDALHSDLTKALGCGYIKIVELSYEQNNFDIQVMTFTVAKFCNIWNNDLQNYLNEKYKTLEFIYNYNHDGNLDFFVYVRS